MIYLILAIALAIYIQLIAMTWFGHHFFKKQIDALPHSITQKLHGTSGPQKGKIGELLQYLKLKHLYNRIFPVGDIIDFICVRLEGEDAGIYFIEVKTGKAARMSKDQQLCAQLIKDKKVFFQTVHQDIMLHDGEVNES